MRTSDGAACCSAVAATSDFPGAQQGPPWQGVESEPPTASITALGQLCLGEC